jgi:hypothetical protein
MFMEKEQLLVICTALESALMAILAHLPHRSGLATEIDIQISKIRDLKAVLAK